MTNPAYQLIIISKTVCAIKIVKCGYFIDLFSHTEAFSIKLKTIFGCHRHNLSVTYKNAAQEEMKTQIVVIVLLCALAKGSYNHFGHGNNLVCQIESDVSLNFSFSKFLRKMLR